MQHILFLVAFITLLENLKFTCYLFLNRESTIVNIIKT